MKTVRIEIDILSAEEAKIKVGYAGIEDAQEDRDMREFTATRDGVVTELNPATPGGDAEYFGSVITEKVFELVGRIFDGAEVLDAHGLTDLTAWTEITNEDVSDDLFDAVN